MRNSGADFQHVFNWQLPDMPWHLHRICMLLATACWQTLWLIEKNSKNYEWNYLPSDLIVVQINFGMDVTGSFPRIQKQLRECNSEIHIVRTAAPFPSAGGFQSTPRKKQLAMSWWWWVNIENNSKTLTSQFCALQFDCRPAIAWNLVCESMNRWHHCHHRCAEFLSDSVDWHMDHIRTTSTGLDYMPWLCCALLPRPISHTQTHSLCNLRNKQM